MTKLTRIIEKHLKGKKILLLFLFTNIVYAFMLLVTIPKVMTFSNGMKLLDMLPMGYSNEYVHNLFNALGEQGRYFYLNYQIPVDMIYPGLFAISYCLILAYFLNKLNRLKSLFTYLCLLPIIAGFFDYMENLGISAMLVSYPEYSQNLVKATNIFTIFKSISTTLYFIVLLVLLILFGLKSLIKK